MKRYILKALIILPVLIMSPVKPLFAGEIRIMVSDFGAQGVPKDVSVMVTDWVRTAVSNSRYVIVDRSRMNEILKEQQLQMTGLTDSEKAVEAGKLLSANRILSGSVSRVGSKYVISGRLVDIEKGTTGFGHSEATWKLDDLDFCTQRFCDSMMNRIAGTYLPAERTNINPEVKAARDPEAEKRNVRKSLYTMYDAYSNRDLEAYMTYIDDNARFWCSAYDISGKNRIMAMRRDTTFRLYDNFHCQVKDVNVTIDGDTATVYDTYVLTYTVVSTGKRVTESAKERFKLIKRGNSWYILENQEY
jgi:ketosteroid isomerase-like protein/TolB-like protein